MDTKKLQVEVLDKPVGILTPGEPPKYVFTYLPDTPASHFVSLTMPVRAESYVWNEGLHPAFQMNLPEGYQKELLRQKLGRLMPVDDFGLLALTGNRGIGRVTMRPYGQEVSKTADVAIADILARPDSRQALLNVLPDLLLANVSGVMPKLAGTATESLPLGQDKRLTAVTSDWILKTGRQDTPGIAINEHLCMNLAREIGLPVPETSLSNDGEVFAIRRFDRDQDGSRLGLEDFCSLMGMPPHEKYDATMEGIAKHLYIWCAEAERIPSAKRLIDMLVLNVVVHNADAHAKNYAVLYSDQNDATLAPVFDVVTVAAYPEYSQSPFALSVGGRKTWNLRKELDRFCVERLNLATSTVSDSLEKIAAGMQKVVPRIEHFALKYPSFREAGKRMLRFWDTGLHTMTGKNATFVKVDFRAPKLSKEKPKQKRRKSKRRKNPEKMN